MSADRLDSDRLARLARIQALFVRLLFCNQTTAAYREDPGGVLAGHNLEPSVAEMLPDVESPAFLAEARGRQSLIRREVENAFSATLNLLAKRESRSAGGSDWEEPGDPLVIGSFLASESLYDPRGGLPHPSGVGPGYENASKYFFWFRRTRKIAAPGADIELRTVFYCDFAGYLMNLMTRPAHDFFRRFTGGVFWPRTPGEPLPVHLVTEKLALLTILDAAKARQLPAIGLQNLDVIRPGEWDIEDNI